MFFENARMGHNAWWRWGLTILGTLVIWAGGHAPLIVFTVVEARRLGLDGEAILSGELPPGIDGNLFLLVSLFPLAAAFFGLWGLIRLLHRKPLLVVITGRARFAWGRAFAGFAVWFTICVAGLFTLLPPDSYRWAFDSGQFLPLLLIALFVLPLQTTFEETFFRGYLMQGVSLLTGERLVPLLVITVVFVAIHAGNPEFGDDWVKGFFTYFGLSLLLGLATVFDDGIEVAAGIHAANNMVLVLIFSPSEGSLDSAALFKTSLPAMLASAPWSELVSAALGLAALMAIFRWRVSRLFAPIGGATPSLQGRAE